MSFKTYEYQQLAIMAANLENKKKQCLADIYRQHPDYIPCEANDRFIIEVIEQYAGLEVIPTLSLFEDAIALNPDVKFVRRPVARQKEQIIDEIMDLLERTNSPSWNTAAAVARVKAEAAEQAKNGSTANNLAFAIADAKEIVRHNIKNERAKMSFWSPEALRARLSEIVSKQSQQPLTGGQLQDQLKQHRAAQGPHRYHPYELLDPQITVDGLIKILRSSEAKKYLRRFGSTQLNDKLFGR